MAAKVVLMAKVRPFKAIIYNQDKFKDITDLVCPPYDVISPQEQKDYHQLNRYNFIHILLGLDAAGDDKYKRAAIYFKEWLKENIFIEDNKPAVYLHVQDYVVRGEKKTRVGFIALLGLPRGDSSVFAHEHTRLEPREDRLKLIKAVKANLSPIFVVFPDKSRLMQRITTKCNPQEHEPFVDISDRQNIRNRLWKIDSPELISEIESKMSDENIFIADGHHRYEVACAYRDYLKEKKINLDENSPANYVMAYFTNSDPRGLTIMPIHRLVRLKDAADFDKIFDIGQEYFDIEEIKDKTKFFFLLEKAGKTEHVIGMYKNKRYWLLRLKNIKILDKMIPDKPKEYRSLDASILNTIMFSQILGLDSAGKDGIIFSPDAQELMERSESSDEFVLFLLNPVNMQQIISVALTGNRMPPKSTYFYPKILSGLLINKLDGSL